MKIASTPTIIDRQKEHKEIMLEINRLKAEKEILKREVGDYTEAKTALQKEVIGGVHVSDLKDTVLSNIRANLQDDIYILTKNKEALGTAVKNRKSEIEILETKQLILAEDNEKSKHEYENLLSKLKVKKELQEKENSALEEAISKKRKELVVLEKQKVETLEKITGAEQNSKEKQAFLLKEEVRLANKGSDLAIYEARLRKKYLELWPEMEIVI